VGKQALATAAADTRERIQPASTFTAALAAAAVVATAAAACCAVELHSGAASPPSAPTLYCCCRECRMVAFRSSSRVDQLLTALKLKVGSRFFGHSRPATLTTLY